MRLLSVEQSNCLNQMFKASPFPADRYIYAVDHATDSVLYQ